MQYLYETHIHTSEVSGCGKVSIRESVELYKQKGYSGMMVTDHMIPSIFEKCACASWNDKVSRFLEGYLIAKDIADYDFDILLGMELRFVKENNNDYLIFGITEDFLRNNPEPYFYSLKEFRNIANENNILIIQAHPFRNGMTVTNPKYLDGIETHNGHSEHQSRNEIALAWAKLNNLMGTSGSDFHRYADLARGGMYFNRRIKEESIMVKELLEGKYALKTI